MSDCDDTGDNNKDPNKTTELIDFKDSIEDINKVKYNNIQVNGWIYTKKLLSIYKKQYMKRLHYRLQVTCDRCTKIITNSPGYHTNNENDLCISCMKNLIKKNELYTYTKNINSLLI